MNSTNCIFCRIARKEIGSEAVVYEDNDLMAFLDLNPVHPGHTLLIPKSHYSDLLETGEKELSRLLSVGNKLAIAIMKAVNAPGFNIHINTKPEAGQVIFHTHLHILPRFKGDNLKHWQGTPTDAEKRKEVAEKIKANL